MHINLGPRNWIFTKLNVKSGDMIEFTSDMKLEMYFSYKGLAIDTFDNFAGV